MPLGDPLILAPSCSRDKPGLRPSLRIPGKLQGGNWLLCRSQELLGPWCHNPNHAALLHAHAVPAALPPCCFIPGVLSALSPDRCPPRPQSRVQVSRDRPWMSSACPWGQTQWTPVDAALGTPCFTCPYSPRSVPGPRVLCLGPGAHASRNSVPLLPLLLRAPSTLPLACSHGNQTPSEGDVSALQVSSVCLGCSYHSTLLSFLF